MALERVFEEEIGKIDEEAQIKKNIISYFNNLINLNYDSLKKIFYPVIKKEFDEEKENLEKEIIEKGIKSVRQNFFDEQLYFKTSKMINELENNANSVMGIISYREKIEDPDISLGFSEYFKWKGINFYGKKLTNKGIEELNLYRLASGLLPIAENRKRSLKRLDKILE